MGVKREHETYETLLLYDVYRPQVYRLHFLSIGPLNHLTESWYYFVCSQKKLLKYLTKTIWNVLSQKMTSMTHFKGCCKLKMLVVAASLYIQRVDVCAVRALLFNKAECINQCPLFIHHKRQKFKSKHLLLHESELIAFQCKALSLKNCRSVIFFSKVVGNSKVLWNWKFNK